MEGSFSYSYIRYHSPRSQKAILTVQSRYNSEISKVLSQTIIMANLYTKKSKILSLIRNVRLALDLTGIVQSMNLLSLFKTQEDCGKKKQKVKLVFLISLISLERRAQYLFPAWLTHELSLISRFKILSISVFTVISPT